ncbi:uncharacterized protein LOC130452877 [Diorhabda sublineata]|uniref:uncharacterized protein LOC130452877 n=1 Tax=Diorhabda sublineata TaxID=1163346 RepID=UPI0024E14346|nr:uncharacterized protein LOC130452877 [Diorhabda sublineata]
MARVGVFSLVLFITSGLSITFGEQKEIMIDEEIPLLKADKHVQYVSDNVPIEESSPCHMEYQVMKKVVGTCVRLGRTARGCVAGNYLHPFHPECI